MGNLGKKKTPVDLAAPLAKDVLPKLGTKTASVVIDKF